MSFALAHVLVAIKQPAHGQCHDGLGMNRGSRCRCASFETREEVARGLPRLGQAHGREKAEGVAATDTTSPRTNAPGSALLADAKREAGDEAVGVIAGRQSRDRKRGELPGFHGERASFLGAIWAHEAYNIPQHRATPRNADFYCFQGVSEAKPLIGKDRPLILNQRTLPSRWL